MTDAIWLALRPLFIGTGILCWACAVAFSLIVFSSEWRSWLARRRRKSALEGVRRRNVQRDIRQALRRAGCLLVVTLGALAATPATEQAAMTRLQSRGAVLRGYRTAFGLTQAQLSVMSGIPASKISRIERGLDSATATQELAIALPLDSIFRSRFHPGTESWLQAVVIRARRWRPVEAGAVPDTPQVNSHGAEGNRGASPDRHQSGEVLTTTHQNGDIRTVTPRD